MFDDYNYFSPYSPFGFYNGCWGYGIWFRMGFSLVSASASTILWFSSFNHFNDYYNWNSYYNPYYYPNVIIVNPKNGDLRKVTTGIRNFNPNTYNNRSYNNSTGYNGTQGE